MVDKAYFIQVDSFHINVGSGDSAIHILSEPPDANTQNRRRVLSAVMIDGGTGGHGAIFDNDSVPTNVYRTIQYIQSRFWCQAENGGYLKFNSFVITHFDQDHCDGLFQFLKEDSMNGKAAKLSRAFYDAGGSPLSYLFTPNWKDGTETLGNKTVGKWPPRHCNTSGSFKADDSQKHLRAKSQADNQWYNILKLRCSPWDVIGRNFFEPDKGFTKDEGKTFKSIQVLLWANPPTLGDTKTYDCLPGMYCIGAMQHLLGEVGTQQQEPTAGNMSSIACLIIWKSGGNGVQVSHYFAGDADEKFEKRIYDWVKSDENANTNPRNVVSMKLSHHGSATSTPTDMLSGFNPSNVICSAGSRHGHPRWELLVMLEFWRHNRNNQPVNEISFWQPLFLTQYVQWLMKDNGDDWNLTSTWSPKEALSQAFFDRIEVLKDKLGPISQGIGVFEDLKTKINDLKAVHGNDVPMKELKIAILEYSETILASITSVKLTATGASTGAQKRVSNAGGETMFVQLTQAPPDRGNNGCVIVMDENGTHDFYDNMDYDRKQWLQSTKPVWNGSICSRGSTFIMKRHPLIKDPKAVTVNARGRLEPHYVGIFDPTLQNSRSNPRQQELWQLLSTFDTHSAMEEQYRSWDCLNKDGIAITSPPVTELGPCYLSTAKDLPSGSTVVNFPVNHALYNFVDSLHYRIFGILRSDPPSSSETTIGFAENDEWLGWFQAAHCLESQKCTLSLTSTWPVLQSTEISFAAGYELLGQQIVFETKSAIKLFKTVDVDAAGLKNMLMNKITMVFGLSSATMQLKTNLGSVAQWAGFDHKALLALKAIPLELDISNNARNAMWFAPNRRYETITRLQFKLADSKDSTVLKWLESALKSIDVSIVSIIAKKTAFCHLTDKNCSVQVSGHIILVLSFKIGGISFTAFVEFKKDSFQVTLRNDDPKVSFNALLQWLGEVIGVDKFPLDDWLGEASKILQKTSIVPRELNLTIGVDEKTGKPTKVTNALLKFEAKVTIGTTAENPVIFLFIFGWTSGIGAFFKGGLWCAPPTLPSDVYAKALPDWEEHEVLESILDNKNKRFDGLDLALLTENGVDGVKNIPRGIPTKIVHAQINIDSKEVKFQGKIRCADAVVKSTKVPQIQLDEVGLSLGYSWDKNNRGLYCALDIRMIIFSPGDVQIDDETEHPHALLRGAVIYNKGEWTLQGSLDNLNVGHLASFWLDGSRDNAMKLLKNINIDYIDLVYHYKNGVGSSFIFDGVISLGDPKDLQLKLGLKFEHDEKGWQFNASLGAGLPEGKKLTVGDLISRILPAGDTLDLPDPIENIALVAPGKGELFRLFCSESKDFTILRATIQISKISFTFMQINKTGWKKPKRIVKAAITELPSLDLNMLGVFKQPFDQLFYMWVQDNSESDATNKGLTKADYDAFNTMPETKGAEKLFYKKTKDVYAEKDVLIKPGHHIFVVLNGKGGESEVLLDYQFTDKKKSSKSAINGEIIPYVGDEKPDATNKAPLKKKMGPLTIENVGLYYKDGRLGVTLDATFLIGPIGLSLLGFSVHAPFNKENTFENPPPVTSLKFDLQGLIIAFDRPPLTIAGGFLRSKEDGMDIYAGGLIVGFTPWQFEAMGVYAEVTRPKPTLKALPPANSPSNDDEMDTYGSFHESEGDTFTMFFVICKLNGPLFSVGFADISGLTGGVGVNCDITLPSVTQVIDFPFVKTKGSVEGKDSPIGTLTKLMSPAKGPVWFRPAEGSFWIAAGFSVTAFRMVYVDAVIIIQFTPTVKIGIVGMATMDLPALESPVKFAHAELGIVCTLDVEAGVFKLEAQLTPRSYVLAPSCHLTGGMALYSWFKNNPAINGAAGDWVFTIGGFHKAFTAPVQYPNPPRLGINWSVDDHLSIRGEAYFAITPKCVMAGGRLHASFRLGGLYAFFDAWLDMLINYRPFYFIAEGGVTVGIRLTLDLWIVTIRISVEIGATLMVQGPKFGGNVHVDFWVFGFDIPFGGKPDPAPPLELSKFWELIMKDDAAGGVKQFLLPPAQGNKPPQPEKEKASLITCESGMETDGVGKKDSPPETPWLVRAGKLSFTVTFKFPITAATFQQIMMDKNKQQRKTNVQGADITNDKIYGKPMQLTDAIRSSEAEIVVQMDQPPKMERHLPQIYAADQWEDRKWKIKAVKKPVSQSVWGKYNRSDDPSIRGQKPSSLLNGDNATMLLTTTLTIQPPEPMMSKDLIPKFNIVKDMKQSVFENKVTPKFPTLLKSNKSWEPVISESSYDQVKATWSNALNDTEKTVASWAAKMNWKTPLNGARPKYLIDNLDKLIPAVPMIATGGGTAGYEMIEVM